MAHQPDQALRALISKYLQGKASAEETAFVEDYYAYFDGQPSVTPDAGTGERIFAQLKQRTRPSEARLLRWWSVAAAILLLAGAGLYFWPAPVEKTTTETIQDVAPGSNKAILVLSDGVTIQLDSSGPRTIRPGIRQQGAQLQYGSEAAPSYNTLTTPRGGQFQVRLPDGTMVWLNAASSLQYPTAFTGKERVVKVSGEAYFEVAQDPQRPFRVQTRDNVHIEVLGTHFNVNAYDDEQAVSTTLLHGAIRVNGVTLKPGMQAQLNQGKLSIQENINTAKTVAWKNGVFDFHQSRLPEVMRQLARWYDVEVVFEQGVPDITFYGAISRNISLMGVLKGLQDADVHVKIQGKKLVVMP